uniref:Uncharacterized protein n=1 Tax=viral metagenome TaxID=1070528 RepID=A0A6M3MFS0_9ZZZZ
MVLTSHNKTQLKRAYKDLHNWRKTILKSFREVNGTTYSHHQAKGVKEAIKKDMDLLSHIDPLLEALNILIGTPLPTEIPEVKVNIWPGEVTVQGDFRVSE